MTQNNKQASTEMIGVEAAHSRRSSLTSRTQSVHGTDDNADDTSLQADQQPATASNCTKVYSCITGISVEPTMFLYMLAFMITSVVEQNFFMYKACRVNNNYTVEICKNINKEANQAYKEKVLITTAKFHQWETIAYVFPIFLALFLGSFSDRRGRKLPLLMGLVGKLIYSIMIVVNTKMTTWPVEYIIYTATLPSVLTGADVAIFASCFAYIADISTLHNRTIRVTILDVVYLSAMPLGVALGSYLYEDVFNRSYTDMFTVNASLLALSIVYTLAALKWQTNPRQRSLRELGCCGIWGDFFDMQHVKDSFNTLVKPRSGHRRIFLTALLVSMAFYTFQRDEAKYLYYYTFSKFKWEVPEYSKFKTFKSTAYVIAMLLAVPLMNKLLGWRDTTIIFIGTWAHSIARVFFYFAPTPLLLYIGAVVCSLGPIVGPMIRAMTSKIVPQSERGKVFALLSICDNAVPLISGVCYSQVYQATLNMNHGGGVFILTIATQMAVFSMILCLHVVLGRNSLAEPDSSEAQTQCLTNEITDFQPVPTDANSQDIDKFKT